MHWLKKFGPAQNILGPVKGQGNTLNFLSHTDESFKDETRVCGYNILST